MEEINLGQSACSKIRNIYFSDKKWVECHNEVAKKFTLFKKILGKMQPDREIVEILKEVHHFDTLDIQEVFSMEEDYLKDEPEMNEAGMPKYDGKVVWMPVPVDRLELVHQIRKMLVRPDICETSVTGG
jgi:hypothetical protein